MGGSTLDGAEIPGLPMGRMPEAGWKVSGQSKNRWRIFFPSLFFEILSVIPEPKRKSDTRPAWGHPLMHRPDKHWIPDRWVPCKHSFPNTPISIVRKTVRALRSSTGFRKLREGLKLGSTAPFWLGHNRYSERFIPHIFLQRTSSMPYKNPVRTRRVLGKHQLVQSVARHPTAKTLITIPIRCGSNTESEIG